MEYIEEEYKKMCKEKMLRTYVIKLHPNNPRVFDFCRGNCVIGVGWRLNITVAERVKSIDDFDSLRESELITPLSGADKSSLTRSVNYLKEIVENDGGLLWTKTEEDDYYLCHTNGIYSYRGSEREEDKNFVALDVVNCLDCEHFYYIPKYLVPSQITRNYRAFYATLSKTDEETEKQTNALYNYINTYCNSL